jgi:hypothetical protein
MAAQSASHAISHDVAHISRLHHSDEGARAHPESDSELVPGRAVALLHFSKCCLQRARRQTALTLAHVFSLRV